MLKTSRPVKITINIILGLLSLAWVTPIIFAVFTSFKENQEYNLGNFWDLPKGNNIMANVEYVRKNADLFGTMGNSLLYAVLGAFFAVVIALFAAYAISHLEIRARGFWFMFIYCGTVFPFQLYLVPIYKGYSKLGLYDTRLGMVLFYTAICIPFCMFVLRNFFIGISKEIMESAHIDGANKMQVLLRILVPMGTAPLAVVFLTQFTWAWNDLMFGLTFTKAVDVRTVMTSLSLMGWRNPPSTMLACLCASVPTLVLFGFLQKKFQTGFVYTSK